MNTETPFKIGQFIVFPNENSLTDEKGNRIPLQPKVMAVLVYLARHYSRLVSRQELIDSIWRGNYPVGEKTLTNAIWKIRQTLRQSHQQAIQTIPKSGYKLQLQPCEVDIPITTAPSKASSHLNWQPSKTGSTVTSKSPEKGILVPLYLVSHWAFLRWRFASYWQLILLVLLLAGGLTLWHQHDTPDNDTSIVTYLTRAPGRELFPTVSPTGQFLAYIWCKIGLPSDLYIKDLHQADAPPQQLTFDNNSEHNPVWSKNGQQLFFVQKNFSQDQCYIKRLILHTRQQQQIALCPNDEEIHLALSHDGSTLAFTGKMGVDEVAGIYLLNLESQQAKPYRFSCGNECQTRDLQFAFSPDDQQLAIARAIDASFENIHIVNIKTKHSRQLTFTKGDIRGLTWHPDGQSIVYAVAKYGQREGYKVSIANGDKQALNVPGFSYPQFSPDGRSLLYHSWQIRKHISSVALSGDNHSAFPLLQSEFDHGYADYSASADRLVYTTNQSGFMELWSSNIQGNQRQQLTHMKSHLRYPRWSHDGKKIVFLGPKKASTGNTIYVLTVDSGLVKAIETPFEGHFRPSWRYNDKALLAIVKNHNQQQLYHIGLDGQVPHLLLDESVGFAVEDQQQRIWYSKGRNSGLWRYDSHQKINQQLISDEVMTAQYNWAVTEAGVYFQKDHLDHHSIEFYQFDNRQLTSLLKFPLRTLVRNSTLNFIAKQNRLILTESEFPQVDIKQLRHSLL